MARADDEFVAFAGAASSRLLHAAYLLTGDRHLAEDAAQTALLRTYVAWPRIRRDDAYSYARTVLANFVIDGWRRPVRERATGIVPERPTGHDVAVDVSRRRWVVDALGTLPTRERAVVVLRHFFDLSEAEVARELNISIGAVKSMGSRALAKLRVYDDRPADTLPDPATNRTRT